MNTTSHPDPEANSDDHDHDHRLVTDGGTALDAGVDPDATVAAELHYTAFADTDVFVALVQRHGLDYAGTTNDHLPGPGATPFVWGKNHGTDEQVLLATGCHPVTGEFHAGGYREEGYASYLYLAGPAYAAEPLYQDVHETAEYMKGEFQPLAPVEGDGDADERVQESTIMTDGGARTASADTDGGSTTTNPDADPTEFGVLPETHHDVERVASERGAYLAATTDLDRRQGRSVGYLELGFSDAGAARKIGVAPTTVSGWISRTVAQYGPRVGFPTPASERGDLVEVTRERVLDLPHAEREQFREAAVENPGVVPGEVLAVLSDGAGGDGGEHR